MLQHGLPSLLPQCYQLIGIDKITLVRYVFLIELAKMVSSPVIELPFLSVGYKLFSVIASIFDFYRNGCLNLYMAAAIIFCSGLTFPIFLIAQ